MASPRRPRRADALAAAIAANVRAPVERAAARRARARCSRRARCTPAPAMSGSPSCGARAHARCWRARRRRPVDAGPLRRAAAIRRGGARVRREHARARSARRSGSMTPARSRRAPSRPRARSRSSRATSRTGRRSARLAGRGDPPRVQWCHGAPGHGHVPRRAAPGDEEHGALLAAGGELVWRVGPIARNAGLCHGTAGNGFAFLALLARTGDERWLERARAFAMHALDQVARSRPPTAAAGTRCSRAISEPRSSRRHAWTATPRSRVWRMCSPGRMSVRRSLGPLSAGKLMP